MLMQLPVYEISLVVIRCKSSIMSPVTWNVTMTVLVG